MRSRHKCSRTDLGGPQRNGDIRDSRYETQSRTMSHTTKVIGARYGDKYHVNRFLSSIFAVNRKEATKSRLPMINDIGRVKINTNQILSSVIEATYPHQELLNDEKINDD